MKTITSDFQNAVRRTSLKKKTIWQLAFASSTRANLPLLGNATMQKPTPSRTGLCRSGHGKSNGYCLQHRLVNIAHAAASPASKAIASGQCKSKRPPPSDSVRHARPFVSQKLPNSKDRAGSSSRQRQGQSQRPQNSMSRQKCCRLIPSMLPSQVLTPIATLRVTRRVSKPAESRAQPGFQPAPSLHHDFRKFHRNPRQHWRFAAPHFRGV